MTKFLVFVRGSNEPRVYHGTRIDVSEGGTLTIWRWDLAVAAYADGQWDWVEEKDD